MGDWDDELEADAPEALGEGADEAFDEFDGLDALGAEDEVDELPEEVRAELEAVAAAEAATHDALEEALAETTRALEAQRAATRAAVARYREALLKAETQLPPDLVQGETLEDLDASVEAARQAVAMIRARMTDEDRERARGFPVGSPARTPHSSRPLSSAEKIAAGLSERLL